MKIIGLDYSTQQLKAVIVNNETLECEELCVNFDSDLPHYQTKFGVHIDSDKVQAPTLMWIEATDVLFEKLTKKYADLSDVIAISGSGQQHGSIFWKSNSVKILKSLDPEFSLKQQLENQFSFSQSPVWMDCSTSKQCAIINEHFGGKLKYHKLFGSTLVERFTGAQLLKLASEYPEIWRATEHVSLVSDGMCSLFCQPENQYAPIDQADAVGSGMTVSGSLAWNVDICSLIPENTIEKLPKIVPSNSVLGPISSYFVKRYGFSDRCQVITFTGDNPSSIVGINLCQHEIAISLGTSDTMLCCFSKLPHVNENIPLITFPHPICNSTFVSMAVYKNGAQIRKKICDKYCNGDWSIFSRYLNETNPGNNGIFGVMNDLQEITPPLNQGYYFVKIMESGWEIIPEHSLTPEQIVRCLIEGQLLMKYIHFMTMTPDASSTFNKVLITGGASYNKEILQIAADIFNLPVETIEVANSASLGAVFRAVAASNTKEFFDAFTSQFHNISNTINPRNSTIYGKYTDSFRRFVSHLQEQSL